MADTGNFYANALGSIAHTIAGNRDYSRQLAADQAINDRAAQELEYRRSQADIAQANSDRSYALDLQKYEHPNTSANLPTGYRPTADGGQEYIPGGPADPKTINAQTLARTQGVSKKTLPATTVKALGDAGSAVADVGRVNSGFKDSYAGYGSSTVGDVANWAGRNLPGGGLIGDPESAVWWQDYAAQKNVRRHALFGSALTKTEAAAFEQADVNPGMQPDQIKVNLARQDMIAKRAAAKLATAYISQGYPPEVIEGALGVSLEDLGIAGPAPTAAGDPAAIQKALEDAKEAVANGVPPEEMKQRLLEQGIDLDAMPQ